MIRNLACVEITCDDCGDDCWEDGIPHFNTLDEAKTSDWFDGWQFTDTEQVCPTCHANRVCVAEGHDWGDWWQHPPNGLMLQHPPNGLMSYRSCDRCSRVDGGR